MFCSVNWDKRHIYRILLKHSQKHQKARGSIYFVPRCPGILVALPQRLRHRTVSYGIANPISTAKGYQVQICQWWGPCHDRPYWCRWHYQCSNNSRNIQSHTMVPSPSQLVLLWSRGLHSCTATLHTLVSKYTSDEMVIPQKLNVFSSPLPNSLMISNPLLQHWLMMLIDLGCSTKILPRFPTLPTTLPQCFVTPKQKRQKKKRKKHENLPNREERMPSMMPKQFDIADGYVTFCWMFKYLGSHISYS